MGCRERLERYLRENGVPFEVQDHRMAYTAQQIAAAEHVPGRMLAKVVMVLADGELSMLVLSAPSLVDLERAGEMLGGKAVRLADEMEFAPAFPDCEPGAMPPFGNLYGLPVYVDRALTRNETIVFQAGTHTETMSVTYADFERLAQPAVAEFGYLP
ncbi:MAG: YbaK/EbsC family protein [Actinobacteria bacterium]|nr:YbaK/EbsC family protein [Actinomycetota bacterium]